ncbi:hypothetical protein ABGB12_26040 [Actinocorallia sp. B10E7]|uniref:hypothetical protein n=1 Tax=Actinocorallia sp. B10E7 TaxID=3153558 RepID=UPI00325C6BDC
MDDYEWKTAGEAALPSVLKEIENTLASDEAAAVRLWHPAGETGGNLMFMPGGKVISFLPVHQPKMLSEPPSEFTDNGWYVARLVPVLADLGLTSIRTRDEYP